LAVGTVFLESRGEHQEVGQGDLIVCECSGPHHGWFRRLGDRDGFVGLLHSEYMDLVREL
jgi:hypothetical protein